MTTEDQIKALAKLDGRECCCKDGLWDDTHGDFCCELHADRPTYLTSYDAIIPLVQKQSEEVIQKMGDHLRKLPWKITTIIHTPSQLAEALLRATGKWKD